MYRLKHTILTALALALSVGAWAQTVNEELYDTVALTPDATYRVWTLAAMPDTDAILFYTLAEAHSVAFVSANAFSIAGGQATVSVDGTAATLTDDTLSGLYPGQQVTLAAAQGYKFRSATASEATEPAAGTLTATFGTPGYSASYTAPTYTWMGSTSNLMTLFEFANGELANYTKLNFTISNLSDGGSVRLEYYVGSESVKRVTYYSGGMKTVDLTALGIDLAAVTRIAFGGNSSAGSCDIVASDVILTND